MSVTMELDPIFVKALKLLQSKAKDSGAQLKAMLDDAIAQRKGLKVPSQSGDAEKPASSKSRNDEDVKKKEGEKRPVDKTHKDTNEPDHKKPKLDSSKQKSSEREARDKDKERERSKKEKERKEKEEKEAQRQKDKAEKERKEKESLIVRQVSEIEIPSDEEEQTYQVDAEDIALEMGIACVVCKLFDVSSGNQLIECQECGSLYHQECHKPSVTGDVNDPRFVWYCSKCTKSLKKMVTQKPAKPKQSTPIISNKESPTASSKPIKSKSNIGSQAFRKIDPKSITTPKEISNSSSTKPMVGLAGLAANLAKPRGEAKTSGSMKKTDQKEGAKSSSKVEGKSSSSKQDSTSKTSSSSKSENRKTEDSKNSVKEEKDKERKSDPKAKSDSKKSGESSNKSSSSSSSSSLKEDKKSDSKASDKKSDSGKSPSHTSSSKSDNSSTNNKSPPQNSSTSQSTDTATTKGNNSNKQAVANLSMVTANKRIQMMKKKAQAKPQEKKVHIK